MNTKTLRNKHRNTFTHFEEREIKEDVWIRFRVLNSNYKHFKPWLRSLPRGEVQGILGKASKVYHAHR